MLKRRDRRHRRKHRAQSEEMTLQITSMADIFTILLVFLLKSISSGSIQVANHAGLLLPHGESREAAPEALRLEISPSGIALEDRQIEKLAAFKFDPRDLDADGTPHALNAALLEHRERSRRPASQAPAAAAASGATSDDQGEAMLIYADQRTPYRVLRKVMESASRHGFWDFKLMVVQR
jgi:biopolymer transport protein ExbD